MIQAELDNSEQNRRKKILLREFKKIALRVSPASGLMGLRQNIGMWISLKTTILLQRIGYNKRKISTLKKKEIILNIGCGSVVKDNLINADLFPPLGTFWHKITHKQKLEADIFLNLGSYDQNLANLADGIVLSHVLEHLPPRIVINALRNCFNYLKPGGNIRVSVPHLAAYEQEDIPQYQGVTNQTLAKNSLIYAWGHHFMYDGEIMTLLMEEAGFKEVKEVAFGEGILNETDVKSRQEESIYLTGLKG